MIIFTIAITLALIYCWMMSKILAPGLGELLRYITELVDRGAAIAYKQKELNYRPRYTPIMRVLADGSCLVSDITARVEITQGAVSQTLALMEADGLINRAQGKDARQTVVTLTHSGQALLEILKNHWDATFAAIDDLEQEIGTPLRAVILHTLSALKKVDFSERIAKFEKKNKSSRKKLDIKPSQGHFHSGGQGYATYRPTYPIEVVQFLSDTCESRQLAVDVGCGSGQISVQISDYFDKVIATDISENQLKHADERTNISYHCEPAEAISVKSNSANLIVAAQAAHWFDLSKFYKEVHRISKPNAILALISYGIPFLDSAINTKFQQFYWQKTTSFWPAERYHVETGYTELPFPFEILPAPQFSIHRDWSLNDFINYLKTWSAIRNATESNKNKFFDEFCNELKVLWGNPEALRHITWPITIRLGRVRKAKNGK